MSDAVFFAANDLTFRYRSSGVVLDGLKWTVGPGVMALLGPNGAGKTTLLNCLLGLLEPRSGHVTVRPVAREIGYVPQSPELPGQLRVRDAIAYAAWLNDVADRELTAAAERAMTILGIEDLADRRVRTLSGGQARRAVIAAGIAHRPRVLLLDEPTAGLDPSQRLNVRRAIASLTELEATVISTHLLEDVRYLCDTVSVLSHGTIAFQGPVQELIDRFADDDTDEDQHGSRFEVAYEQLVDGQGGARA